MVMKKLMMSDGTHASQVCSAFSTPNPWEASCMHLRRCEEHTARLLPSTPLTSTLEIKKTAAPHSTPSGCRPESESCALLGLSP